MSVLSNWDRCILVFRDGRVHKEDCGLKTVLPGLVEIGMVWVVEMDEVVWSL